MKVDDQSEYTKFEKAMAAILKADPKAVKQAMEAEKQANAEKKKTRLKDTSNDKVR